MARSKAVPKRAPRGIGATPGASRFAHNALFFSPSFIDGLERCMSKRRPAVPRPAAPAPTTAGVAGRDQNISQSRRSNRAVSSIAGAAVSDDERGKLRTVTPTSDLGYGTDETVLPRSPVKASKERSDRVPVQICASLATGDTVGIALAPTPDRAAAPHRSKPSRLRAAERVQAGAAAKRSRVTPPSTQGSGCAANKTHSTKVKPQRASSGSSAKLQVRTGDVGMFPFEVDGQEVRFRGVVTGTAPPPKDKQGLDNVVWYWVKFDVRDKRSRRKPEFWSLPTVDGSFEKGSKAVLQSSA